MSGPQAQSGLGSTTVMLSANASWNLVNFRAPIIAALTRRGHRVVAAVPDDGGADSLRSLGVEIEFVPVDARGVSPLRDLRLFLSYRSVFRRVRPDAFLAFTAKPNIYGSLAAALCDVPVINTITGLGTAFLSGRALQAIVSRLYRLALRRSKRVFFHNKEDCALFVDRKLVRSEQAAVVAGSGVDLERFSPRQNLKADGSVTFLFIGRMLTDKGAMEFARAAEIVGSQIEARFRMLGSVEDHPKAVSRDFLEEAARRGTIELLGTCDDVRPVIADSDCVVLPSYREGLPRVLLEASAMGKPVIATDVPGCRDAVADGVTGLLCEPRSAASLARAMTAMAAMTPSERGAMGKAGRLKAEREFSIDGVVNCYLDALHSTTDQFAAPVLKGA